MIIEYVGKVTTVKSGLKGIYIKTAERHPFVLYILGNGGLRFANLGSFAELNLFRSSSISFNKLEGSIQKALDQIIHGSINPDFSRMNYSAYDVPDPYLVTYYILMQLIEQRIDERNKVSSQG